MKLISSREAVNFLSQAAPRPWIQRLLRWMALEAELTVYSRKGRVQASCLVGTVTLSLVKEVGEYHGPKMDAEIRKKFDQEFAAKLIGKNSQDRINDEPFVWEEGGEPQALDPGFMLFADEIDWDAGILKAENLPSDGELHDTFFGYDSDLFGSELHKPDFEALIEGLSFEFSKIEMLLPSMEIGRSVGFTAAPVERGKALGRPPKWDWEGALAFVTSRAQHPDGLPTGPGAQSKIEAIIADWFVQQTGEAPAPSQVRQRAAKIMQMIEMPEKL